MTSWQSLLDTQELILADGAMGTMLFEAGLQFGDPPEGWNLDHPDQVRRVHLGYLEAGGRILLTNTFGGNRFRLGMHNLEGRVAELNRAGATVAREAVRAAGARALVAGDIGPSGRILAPLGRWVCRGRGRLCGAGGSWPRPVWALRIETMSIWRCAIEGVGGRGMPLITTMTFDAEGGR
jgi:5-methyltetrahydrofolate--homocysteine methyltransferase